MATHFNTELEALEAIYGAITDKNARLIELISQINEISTDTNHALFEDGETVTHIVDQMQDKVRRTLEDADAIDAKLLSTNTKLDLEIALTQGIRGAVVDVKNQPTDACIIRVYVGDQTNKRNAAAREITRLLGEGYRPYQTFGISEDLARVLFVKYPEPNDANPVEP